MHNQENIALLSLPVSNQGFPTEWNVYVVVQFYPWFNFYFILFFDLW